jgi:TetR/AcrR family transcriptional regulator
VSRGQPKQSARSRLLKAAVQVVAHHGYAEATVAHVISSAGASRSTFYEEFVDKDACVLVAAEEICEQLAASLEERMSAEEPRQVPIGIAEALFEFALAERAQARLLFTELLAGGSRAMDLRDALIDRLAALIEGAWSRRVDEQEPTFDLPARALIGGIFRLLSFRMRRGGEGLHGVQPEVLAWINAFTLESGKPHWQDAAELMTLPALAPPSLAASPVPDDFPRGRHGVPASEIAQKHRDRLLRATTACVYRNGYATVSVADIVSDAQVSRGVFYNHFHDKKAAALAAMNFTFATSMTAGAGAFFTVPATETSWPEQLWAAAHALSDYYAAAPELIYLAFVEGFAVGPESMQMVEERMMPFTLLLEPGYHYSSMAGRTSAKISKIIAFATFELAYREVRQRQPRQFSHLLPQLAYVNLAPFMGAHAATDFVRTQMLALSAAG